MHASPEEATLFSYALYLLAKWREVKAFPYVLRWLSLPGEEAFDLSGDVPVQDGGRILAAVCDGNLEPILGLACDPHANEFCRGTAVHALALLAAWGEVPRDTVVAHFLYLASGGLERRPSHVWNSLVAESADIEALPVVPDLRRAYDEGLINPGSIEASWLDRVEASPPGRVLQETRERHPPIDDVAEATRWWADFAAERTGGTADGAVLPHRRGPRVGRNEPCPCGSGKKFKKCCGA